MFIVPACVVVVPAVFVLFVTVVMMIIMIMTVIIMMTVFTFDIVLVSLSLSSYCTIVVVHELPWYWYCLSS